MHVCVMLETATHPYHDPKASLLLHPLVHSHHCDWINSDNTNSLQNQLPARNKQAIATKFESANRSENQHKHTLLHGNSNRLTLSTVPCMSNDLICGYIAGIPFCLYRKDVKYATTHCNVMNTIHILYTDNLTIIYAADNS